MEGRARKLYFYIKGYFIKGITMKKEEIKLNQDTKNVGEVATLDNDVHITELTEEETQGRF